MKDYDFAFSLGFSCGVSQALRAAGMQFASYPLDWLATRGVAHVAKIVAGDFDGWFEYDDFQLVDVRHGTGFCTRCYLNAKTGLGYSHEFPDFMPFAESFPKVRQTYERRVKRFVERADASRRMLAVYLELPLCPRVGDDEILEARRILAERFPAAEVDVLYIFVEPGRSSPALGEIAPGAFTASYDYRKYDGEEVTHFVDWAPLVPFFRANFHVEDTRSSDERKKFSAFEKKSDDMRWGPDKSRFRRWLNKHLYKTYRSLEQVLIRRGLVHREGPLWDFYPELVAGRGAAK